MGTGAMADELRTFPHWGAVPHFPVSKKEPEKLRRSSIDLKHFRELHFIGQKIANRRIVEQLAPQ